MIDPDTTQKLGEAKKMCALENELIETNNVNSDSNGQQSLQETEPNTNISTSTSLMTITINKNTLTKGPIPPCPRIDSKLILQNMEEVLLTMRQKHREKHRRKREQKRLFLAEQKSGAQSNNQNYSKSSGLKISSSKHQHGFKSNRRNYNNSLCDTFKSNNSLPQSQELLQLGDESENQVQSQSQLPSLCVLNTINNNKEAQPDIIEEMFRNDDTNSEKSTSVDSTTSITNVFDIMMSSRNKPIIVNSTGQTEVSLTNLIDNVPDLNAKRKQKLQEWGDIKGSKRRLEEEANSVYVEKQLKQRTKRFRQMLANGEKKSRNNSQRNESPCQDVIINVEKTAKKRGRPRRNPIILDSESNESNLNSPTVKNQDCDVVSTKNKFEEKLIETPKSRNKISVAKKKLVPKNNLAKHSQATYNSNDNDRVRERPRRSCTVLSGYNLLSGKKPRNTSTEIIDLVSESETPKKLAPMFIRTSMPRPRTDPDTIKARRAFLQSGIPRRLHLEKDKEKNYDTNDGYPAITHITQISNERQCRKSSYSYKLRSEHEITSPTLKSITKHTGVGFLSDCTPTDFHYNHIEVKQRMIRMPRIQEKRDIIKLWKLEYDVFPTYRCYNQMREKLRCFDVIQTAEKTEQLSESFVVTRYMKHDPQPSIQLADTDNLSIEMDDEPAAPNGSVLYSEKYKPMRFEQVLMNLSPVTELRQFLANWNQGRGSNTSNVTNDFINLDESNSSQPVPYPNVVVLVGPVASGKTNAVFALANDMNFNVLEINAGMKRTGRRLIQELQEATQSHQVRKDNKQNKLIKSSSNGRKSKSTKAKRETLPTTEVHLSTVDDEDTMDSNYSNSSWSDFKSLLLIEDADVVFDETDAGYVDAIYTLAASSKRPVILIASDMNCVHLKRFMNIIRFNTPSPVNVARYLSVLALVENCPIDFDNLQSLYIHFNEDIRRTLISIQFYIQSGGDNINAIDNVNTEDKQTKEKCQNNVNEAIPLSNNTNTIANNCDKMSVLSTVYFHSKLFGFYTFGHQVFDEQKNTLSINLPLLSLNLIKILKIANNYHEQQFEKDKNNHRKNVSEVNVPKINNKTSKRRTRSPKKQWLKNATTKISDNLLINQSFDDLERFYENMSVASLLGHRYIINNHLSDNCSIDCVDRSMPQSAEIIAYYLAEKAIDINLNLANNSEWRQQIYDVSYLKTTTLNNQYSLCKELNMYNMHTKRNRQLDYEPTLRSICRSEKARFALERRSTRLYHYIRNFTTKRNDWSTIANTIEKVCLILQTTINTNNNDKENYTEFEK